MRHHVRQRGQRAVHHVGRSPRQIPKRGGFEGPDVGRIKRQPVGSRVDVGFVQAVVVGFKIREPQPGMAPDALPFLEQGQAAESGFRHGRCVALQPPVVGGVSTDQGAFKHGEGPRDDVGVEWAAKPFLGPCLVGGVGLKHLFHGLDVVVELERVLKGGEHLRFQRGNARLAVKSRLPSQVHQDRCISKTHGVVGAA